MSDSPRHCRLTAPGPAALGSIRVEGPRVWQWVERHLVGTDRRPLRLATNRIRLAYLPLDTDAATAEQLVVCAIDDHVVELHSHGGAGVEAVSRRLTELGCAAQDVSASRAWHDERPTVSDAWRLLPHARTIRCAAVLLDQARGSLHRALQQVVRDLSQGRIAAGRCRLASLAASYRFGRHLTVPFEVVLAGRPNTGKSSLLNALAGYRRALVAAAPGTTRDVLEADMALEGWLVRVTDTAGWHETNDPLERAGIDLGRARVERGDLGVWVIDGAAPHRDTPPGQAVDAFRNRAGRWLTVHNKSDLGIDAVHGRVALPVSALTGAGIDALVRAIAAELVPSPPPAGVPVVFAEEQHAAVERAFALATEESAEEAVDVLREWVEPREGTT